MEGIGKNHQSKFPRFYLTFLFPILLLFFLFCLLSCISPYQEAELLPLENPNALVSRFSLLVWNVAKMSADQFVAAHSDLSLPPAQFYLLQEAGNYLNQPGFSRFFSSNLRKHYVRQQSDSYGLKTLARINPAQTDTFHSRDTEPFVFTTKVVQATSFPISGRTLLVVNVHLLNFVGLRAYKRQLEAIRVLLAKHHGPVVVAGDFNTWSRARHQAVERLFQDFGLSRADFSPRESAIRSFLFSQPFDRVYYRDLSPKQTSVIPAGTYSDHAALWVEFSFLEDEVFFPKPSTLHPERDQDLHTDSDQDLPHVPPHDRSRDE